MRGEAGAVTSIAAPAVAEDKANFPAIGFTIQTLLVEYGMEVAMMEHHPLYPRSSFPVRSSCGHQFMRATLTTLVFCCCAVLVGNIVGCRVRRMAP